MIRINLILDEHTLPHLYQALSQIPPRRRATYLRAQLGKLESSATPAPAPETRPSRPAGIAAGLMKLFGQ